MARVRCFAAAAVVAVALTPARAAQAQLVESRFTWDAEGWISVMLPWPSAIPPIPLSAYPPVTSPGFIRLSDPDGWGATGNTQYWMAPAKFHGDLSSAYGDSLVVGIADQGSGYGSFHQEDVILQGGGLTLVHDFASVPGADFTHYVVPMLESEWRRDGLNGPVATLAELQQVLAAVTGLFIRAEYQFGPDTQMLDEVVVYGVPVTAIAGAAGAPALGLVVGNVTPSPGGAQLTLTLARAAEVDVAVFDVRGQRVATVAHGSLAAGPHSQAWDGRDLRGRRTGSGVYWVQASSGAAQVTRRLLRVD